MLTEKAPKHELQASAETSGIAGKPIEPARDNELRLDSRVKYQVSKSNQDALCPFHGASYRSRYAACSLMTCMDDQKEHVVVSMSVRMNT